MINCKVVVSYHPLALTSTALEDPGPQLPPRGPSVQGHWVYSHLKLMDRDIWAPWLLIKARAGAGRQCSIQGKAPFHGGELGMI